MSSQDWGVWHFVGLAVLVGGSYGLIFSKPLSAWLSLGLGTLMVIAIVFTEKAPRDRVETFIWLIFFYGPFLILGVWFGAAIGYLYRKWLSTKSS